MIFELKNPSLYVFCALLLRVQEYPEWKIIYRKKDVTKIRRNFEIEMYSKYCRTHVYISNPFGSYRILAAASSAHDSADDNDWRLNNPSQIDFTLWNGGKV